MWFAKIICWQVCFKMTDIRYFMYYEWDYLLSSKVDSSIGFSSICPWKTLIKPPWTLAFSLLKRKNVDSVLIAILILFPSWTSILAITSLKFSSLLCVTENMPRSLSYLKVLPCWQMENSTSSRISVSALFNILESWYLNYMQKTKGCKGLLQNQDCLQP